eukprot:SAG31_NODE_148_length_22511_cov_20.369266_6_plen_63_part_00
MDDSIVLLLLNISVLPTPLNDHRMTAAVAADVERMLAEFPLLLPNGMDQKRWHGYMSVNVRN